jgi:hypothetical protein
MRARIGRNAPCRCGSGLKFKRCCGKNPPPTFPPAPSLETLLANPKFSEIAAGYRHQPPIGNLPLPVRWQGRTVRIVGSHLYSRPPQETFHEFMIHVLKWTLGEHWHREQLATPLEKRHVIHQWLKASSDLWRKFKDDPSHKNGEQFWIEPTGEAQALLVLAHDVTHLVHTNALPNDLIHRLKSHDGFQGARYEIAVAATFVRAGCRVKFIEEKVQKHCEFVAEDAATGAIVGVEAKSRHRPGVLHMAGVPDELAAVRGDVEGLINRALDQAPADLAFMIFVDLNTPHTDRGVAMPDRQWFQDLWASMQSFPTPTPDDPDIFNALVITNFSYHWQKGQRASGGEYLYIVPMHAKHPIPELFIGRVLAAVESYGAIPKEVGDPMHPLPARYQMHRTTTTQEQ